MKAAFESEATAESESFSKIAEEREQQKEQRQAQKEEAFKAVDEERESMKKELTDLVSQDR